MSESSDRMIARLQDAFAEMIMVVDFEKNRISIAFETEAETEEAEQALSEAIGSGTVVFEPCVRVSPSP